MGHHDPLKGIRFDPPEAGWMTCLFSTENHQWAFDISDAVNDPLAMFADLLDALKNGGEVPVIELFLEPEWVQVSYDRGREELTITLRLQGSTHVCGARVDDLAYLISMGLKRLSERCAGETKETDWSYPLPKITG